MSKVLVFVMLLVPALAQANTIPNFAGVISAVTMDLNDDAGFDRAVLIDDGNGSGDLYIYLSKFDEQTREYLPMTLAQVKTGLAFNGGMWGQIPSLEVGENKTLLVQSGNDSIGRGRWSQTLKIAYDVGMAVVVGLEYRYRDTLDLEAGGNCNVDFKNGTATRNGKDVPFNKQFIMLNDWNNDVLPNVCVF